MKEIHAHKVLELIKEEFGENLFDFSELNKIVLEKFRENVIFHNCHGSNFTLKQLTDFFISKGKLENRNGKLNIAKKLQCGCNH